MQTISWCHSHTIFNFLLKYWKKVLPNFEYCDNEKSILGEIKNIFHDF